MKGHFQEVGEIQGSDSQLKGVAGIAASWFWSALPSLATTSDLQAPASVSPCAKPASPALHSSPAPTIAICGMF